MLLQLHISITDEDHFDPMVRLSFLGYQLQDVAIHCVGGISYRYLHQGLIRS